MKESMKRLTAAVSAAIIAVSALPCNLSLSAEETYLVRDPFYNYSSGYNYYESEHFQFIWGNSGESSRVTTEFLEGNAKNLEDCWDVYMTDLEMEPPSQSVNLSLRDGNHYKTNIYLSGTGLSGMTDDWAYMSYDSGGFAYMFCCVDSMQYNPPSWVIPHEFGHVVTAHQLGWNTNKYSYAWWEAMGNWYREQYLYSDYSSDETGHGTDFFETYLKNLSLTFPCGRDYYAAWPFLQYLTENPDNLAGYGTSFVKTMLQEGQVDEYPFDMVERLADADIKDTLGHFAKHMAGLDFENGDAYRARLNELLSAGSWNWQQIYTMLEPVAGQNNAYQVPTERAPQYAGMNIVPLAVTGNSVSATLNPLTNIDGADWRACIVQQKSDGSCVYSELFSDGETCTVSVEADASAVYLTVVATPDLDTITKVGLPYGPDSEFAENNYPFTEKEQYPYSVTFGDGVAIQKRSVATGNNWWETYHNHSNGGGLVSDSANVADTVYVGPNAKVLGSATVTGNVRIDDYAVVQDSASVSDNAVIAGYAIIAENAKISGNARVDDTALVMGQAQVSGNAKVIESACVYGTYTMTDYATAKGMAFCMANGSISGEGAVDGDYYDDGGKTVAKGTAYGWVSAQSYVDALPYTDKLIYSYEFSKDSTLSFADKYTSTYGSAIGAPLWEETRTSANGVITLNGQDEFLTLDRSVLYTDNIDIQMAVLSRSSTSGQTILHLGNSGAYIKLVSANESGNPEVIISNGTSSEKLTASSPLTLGAWSIIRIVVTGNEGQLLINGEAAASGTISIHPDDIANAVLSSDQTAVYRFGADENSANCFNGSADFIRIYREKAADPAETYTGTEDITDIPDIPAEPSQVMTGDCNLDARINIFDLMMMKKFIFEKTELTPQLAAASDVNGDKSLTVADAVVLQKYIVMLIDEFPAGAIAEYYDAITE